MKECRSCWLFTTTVGILLMTSTPMAESGHQAANAIIIETNPINAMNEQKEIMLQKGQNFTITCRGKRPVDIMQQKLREEIVGKFTMVDEVLPYSNGTYPFGKTLHLYNVDHFTVGYYMCFDDTIQRDAIYVDIMEEPTDTEHISYFYIYVNDNGPNPHLFAAMSEFAIQLKNSSDVLLQCRPIIPDLNVIVVNDGRPVYDTKISPKIGFLVGPCKHSECRFECNGTRGSYSSTKYLRVRHVRSDACDNITIIRDSQYFMEGDDFYFNCTIPYKSAAIDLKWLNPRGEEKNPYQTNEKEILAHGQYYYKTIKISNATREDEGSYICSCKSGNSDVVQKSEKKVFLDKPYIDLTLYRDLIEFKKTISFVTLKVEENAYPKPTHTFYRDNQRLDVHRTKIINCKADGAVKYREDKSALTGDVRLSICNFTIYDSGNYTIVANNTLLVKNVTIDVRKKEPPNVQLLPIEKIIHQNLNQKRSLRCTVIGYPPPIITWTYTTDNGQVHQIKSNDTQLLAYKVESNVIINPMESGNVTCQATIESDTERDTRRVLVYEIARGFGIANKKTWYPEGSSISLQCIATIYEYNSLTWRGPHGEDLLRNVKYHDSKLSHVATLKIDQISVEGGGTYTCVGHKFNASEEHETINITVEAVRKPDIFEPGMDREEDVLQFQSVVFSCVADAVPAPEITWMKDDVKLENNTDGVNIFYYINHTEVNSTISITSMQDINQGKYECSATSGIYTSKKYIELKVPQAFPYKSEIIGGVVLIILVLIVLVIYLMWKVRKEKKFRKELAAAGLLYFKEGVTRSLNPDLGIDEQAELLPYDEKFEFPIEKLKLGIQLGAGAFGVVYKAEARGIINAEETTPVAVKMVKKNADNMFIKALASELKIMVHLGKHVNIVNLLGACTKNVGKRELSVIVEYCKFGNIYNYMQKHRDVFIDQLTDNKEKNMGKVNRGFSCSSGSSGMNSDYFGTHSQATDHTLLNSTNTNRSERKDKQNQQVEFVKVSETGYVQPEWRSNYESDYSFDGRNPRPLSSRDLLAWAFQIARGMEYLASRKILHGDLAARNVLLAEDNVVKICDFGLARSIYNNDEYQKKENSPLPVKWLAIECMMDRIFTTQSDVWAFGIVLWEMFSLAKTPYPNMSPPHLLQWLSDGHRLEKPPYADDRLYDVMLRCWEHKPNARPSFTRLQELLGSFLEDNVRNHYVDLNTAFMDSNVKRQGEDYLAMVSAPDYNVLVTPSPHHYVNEVRNFFPPSPNQVPFDEEGYLQMTPVNPSIFSPRNQSTKFDFDTRKVEPRVPETRCGSELTPMLTLNSLSARTGSDSDHEGGHSPYLKMCPRIVEETDDVFKINENNEKNIQNSAVTNPTYISLDLDMDKKPQDINSYINIPNGLVK